jgi:transcription antitermination factor NusG
MTGGRWIVAVTQPNREGWALENIERQSYKYYFPQVAERVKTSRHLMEFRARPLFPRHVFVYIEDKWHSLLSTFGVRSIIMFGGNVAVVPERDIQRVRAMEDQMGLVILPRLREGQEVILKRGAFSGQRGIYQGQSSKDRCKVLLAYLGRVVPVLVDSDILKAA